MALVLFLAGCTSTGIQHGMEDQPKAKPFTESEFFADGRSARPLVAGTVARGELHEDELLYTGKLKGKDAEIFPFPITRAVLEHGRERYDIYCAVCHDRAGTGDGMIVRRGFRKPPSYHTDALRKAPAGHFFDVITNGFGTMYPYADRIPIRDRWAIVAYIRALQAGQNATLQDAPEKEQVVLKQMKP
jgi:cytochrome c553